MLAAKSEMGILLFLVLLCSSCHTNEGEKIDCDNQFQSTAATPDSRSGKIILPDSRNFMTQMRITDCDCWVTSSKVNADIHLVKSSFFENTIEVKLMHENSEFYINDFDKKNTYILQLQNAKAVAFTHTRYDENGILIYGENGDGDYIKECGLLQ